MFKDSCLRESKETTVTGTLDALALLFSSCTLWAGLARAWHVNPAASGIFKTSDDQNEAALHCQDDGISLTLSKQSKSTKLAFV